MLGYLIEIQMKCASSPKELQLSAERKAKIAYAAYLRGQTITEFVVTSADEAATRVIQETEIINLRARDRESFAAALLAEAPEPSNKLRAAAERYKIRARR